MSYFELEYSWQPLKNAIIYFGRALELKFLEENLKVFEFIQMTQIDFNTLLISISNKVAQPLKMADSINDKFNCPGYLL